MANYLCWTGVCDVELMSQLPQLSSEALSDENRPLQRTPMPSLEHLTQRAFEHYHELLEQGSLPENDFSRLKSVARALGKDEVIRRVDAERKKRSETPGLYSQENLLVTHDEALVRTN